MTPQERRIIHLALKIINMLLPTVTGMILTVKLLFPRVNFLLAESHWSIFMAVRLFYRKVVSVDVDNDTIVAISTPPGEELELFA